MAPSENAALPTEEFPSKVSATFDTAREANQAANELSQSEDVESGQVLVIAPGDDRTDLKLEPEPRAIRNTWFRAHVLYGAVGIAVGLVLASAAVNSGLDIFSASPLPTIIAITWVTFLSSLMVAGAITLRLDHDVVVHHSRSAAGSGEYLVVAHARSGAEKRRFAKQLKPAANDTASTF